MNTREKFVARFGEDDAKRIEEAANCHRNGEARNPWAVIKNALVGELVGEQVKEAEDQFLLDLATCMSWECLTQFRDAHSITADEGELRAWVRANAVPPPEYRDPCSPHTCLYLGEEFTL